MIPIAKPDIRKTDLKLLQAILLSGKLTQGEYIEKFEHEFAQYIGTKYAVAVTNGTIALYLSLMALRIGRGDEVITTPFTFVATVNSILYCGAKPVFADITADDFNINPDEIEKKITKKTKVILPVHLYGLSAQMDKIIKIAKKYQLYILEDACQAHGAKFGNSRVGSIGHLGCFSFYPTKNMTTGEGGMITTNNTNLAKNLSLLRNHGMNRKYSYKLLGYNFRMTEIQAAIGLTQLSRLNKMNQQRLKNAIYYNASFQNLITPIQPSNRNHVFHQYTLRFNKKRDKIKKLLKDRGISSEIYYPKPIYKYKIYQNLVSKKEKFPVVEQICKQVLSIPIHPLLKKAELNYISQNILKIID